MKERVIKICNAIDNVNESIKKCHIMKETSKYYCKYLNVFKNSLINSHEFFDSPKAGSVLDQISKLIEDFNENLAKFDKDNWIDFLISVNKDEMFEIGATFSANVRTLVGELYPNLSVDFIYEERRDEGNKIYDLSKCRKQLDKWIRDPENASDPRLTTVSSIFSYLTEIEGKKDFYENKMKEVFKNYYVDGNDFVLEEDFNLGTGGFGTVFKATRISTAEYVALKEVRADRLSPNSWSSLYAEVESMSKVHHPYVLQLIGCQLQPYRIITRYYGGRSLFARLHRKSKNYPPLENQHLTAIAYQIALGMQELHSHGIVHRDLKTMNILLDSHCNSCIADFGLSTVIPENHKLKEYVGTAHYSAPEVLVGASYNEKVDVYSYGVVLWEMLEKKVPYASMTTSQIYDQLVTCDWRLPFEDTSSRSLRDLITSCWSKDPDNRPSFAEIVRRFEENNIAFGDSKLDYQKIKESGFAPPINIKYAYKVLSDVDHPCYRTVSRFLTDNMDSDVRSSLISMGLFDILQTQTKEFETALPLAGKVLESDEQFINFLDGNGQKMLDECWTKQISSAIEFLTSVPVSVLHMVSNRIPSLIENLTTASPDMKMKILICLSRFPDSHLVEYKTNISSHFEYAIQKIVCNEDGYRTQKFFDVIQKLLVICSDVLIDFDYSILLPLIQKDFNITGDFLSMVYEKMPESFHCQLIENTIDSMVNVNNRTSGELSLQDYFKKNDGSLTPLCEYIIPKDDIWEKISILMDTDQIQTMLMILFAISQTEEGALAIGRQKIMQKLILFDNQKQQRLILFAFLVQYESFFDCDPNYISGMMKNLISALMDSKTREHAMIMIQSSSAHRKGCLVLQEFGVFEPFVQILLSPAYQDNANAYTIIRNAALYEVPIPQVQLIVSCLMNAVLYDMTKRDFFLDTIYVLVKRMPACAQIHDLRTVIIPICQLRIPSLVLRSLRILAVVDVTRTQEFNRDSKDISECTSLHNDELTMISEMLNDSSFMYPSIILECARVVENISRCNTNLSKFLKTTKILEYFRAVSKILDPEYESIKEELESIVARLEGQPESPLTIGFPQIADSIDV